MGAPAAAAARVQRAWRRGRGGGCRAGGVAATGARGRGGDREPRRLPDEGRRAACARSPAARARRETYVGPWLPEPLVSDDPADRVTLDESVSYALLTVLERLAPAERTAFVPHDVFDVPFGHHAALVRGQRRSRHAHRRDPQPGEPAAPLNEAPARSDAAFTGGAPRRRIPPAAKTHVGGRRRRDSSRDVISRPFARRGG